MRMANPKDSQGSANISRICQLLLTIHKELQLIYNTTNKVDKEESSLQVGKRGKGSIQKY